MSSEAPAAPLLTEEVVEHMACGVDIFLATRNATLAPEAMLAMGIKAHADRRTVTVYLPKALAKAALENLTDNGQVAVTLIRASTFKAVQLKGRLKSVRDSDESDRERQSLHRAAMIEDFAAVGVPRSATRRLVWWPSLAVDIEVDAVFGQTPGPNAGEPLGAL